MTAVLRLVEQIYDAPLEPALWPSFLDALADLLRGGAAAPRVRNRAHCARCPTCYNVARSIASTRRGECPPELKAYLREVGCASTFGADERALLLALAPHIRRALRLGQEIASMAVAKRGLEESVDWLPFAMIVLGPDGRIAFANAAAAAILAAKDGLARGPRGLVASVPQESRALAALVRDAAQPAHRSSRPRRDVMPVSRRSGREPFTLTIVRLCGLDLIHARVPGCAVGVFIDAPATPILVDGDMLRSMYGFTAAQATIAADVVSGGTVSTIALERRIEPSTVRWHLKDVLLKTQCGSQMELIRMLSRGPAALTPPKA